MIYVNKILHLRIVFLYWRLVNEEDHGDFSDRKTLRSKLFVVIDEAFVTVAQTVIQRTERWRGIACNHPPSFLFPDEAGSYSEVGVTTLPELISTEIEANITAPEIMGYRF